MNSSILVALVVVGLIALIIVLLVQAARRQSRKRREAMRREYEELLHKFELSAQKEQEFSHRILGLDGIRRVILACLPETSAGYIVVSLDEVVSCTLSKTDMRRQRDGSYSRVVVSEGHVDSYAISLWKRHDVKVDIPIYVEAEDGAENRATLYLDAIDWHERINALLRRPVRAVA